MGVTEFCGSGCMCVMGVVRFPPVLFRVHGFSLVVR